MRLPSAAFSALPVSASEALDLLARIRTLLGIDKTDGETLAARLPFAAGDATAGAENELQAVVVGSKEAVDLPQFIRHSNYFQNIVRHTVSGDRPAKAVRELNEFLDNNGAQVWENSWVRFPRRRLSLYAGNVLERDLAADKNLPDSPRRCDAGEFLIHENGEEQVRIPVSYLLKLALADAISPSDVHPLVRTVGERFMTHFSNDNTSPETFSFFPVPVRPGVGMGRGIARETLKRYLLGQLLTFYANRRFGLLERGQEALIYFAPHPPLRQKKLNDLISDAFYRELFMSPCLSGWDKGEEKHRYMALCHQVLSRSQLNAVVKLREAGIITRNLVVLPNISNTSLANNGTHISLGSLRLGRLLSDPASGFGAREEKYLGDLVIKIFEHFLPLFVGTYSASPYRLAFQDFHPEKVLGFLPHELDFTHLRMIWRRWKQKAGIRFFGNPVTPFGPEWLDRGISRVFGLKGDFVTDFRLVDYLTCLMSTDRSPALDGRLGNDLRLKKDLASLGVFDPAMATYLLYRLRSFGQMGFSGFEGRYYSQFANLTEDMGEAVNLQHLITALAFQYALSGAFGHGDIPDGPAIESERRQVFFGTAIGIPTFYVRQNTPNRLMQQILRQTARTRLSRRYPGYLRVHNTEYRQALLKIIRRDGRALIDALGLASTLGDLETRLGSPRRHSAAGRLTAGILAEAGASGPMQLASTEFNEAMERFYRHTLRKKQTAEALDALIGDYAAIQSKEGNGGFFRKIVYPVSRHVNPASFLEERKKEILAGKAAPDTLRCIIYLTLISIFRDMKLSRLRDPTPSREEELNLSRHLQTGITAHAPELAPSVC